MRRRRLRVALLVAAAVAGVTLLVIVTYGGDEAVTDRDGDVTARNGKVMGSKRGSREIRGSEELHAGVVRSQRRPSAVTAETLTSHDVQTRTVPLTPLPTQQPASEGNSFAALSRFSKLETSNSSNTTQSVVTLSSSSLKPSPVSEEERYAIPLSGCQCLRRLPRRARRVASSCGRFASLRGPRQHVVSFSWFGGVDTAYFRGIAANAALLPRYYPGWVMRVYYMDPERTLLPWLCPLVCRYPHLDMCEVSGDGYTTNSTSSAVVEHSEGALWRFWPLADPSVERFVSRDLDSLIGQRESDAVREWIKSGKTIHVMRDHPLHAVSILAGAWGAWNHRNDIYRPLRERLIAAPDTAAQVFGSDQARLAEFVYGPASALGDVLEHDSYFCGVFGPSQPFPSQRDISTYPHFVGDRVMFRDYHKEMVTRENWLFYIRKCPLECRPKYNLDWLWC